eukprot:3261138-Rhodomonas_salina.1
MSWRMLTASTLQGEDQRLRNGDTTDAGTEGRCHVEGLEPEPERVNRGDHLETAATQRFDVLYSSWLDGDSESKGLVVRVDTDTAM